MLPALVSQLNPATLPPAAGLQAGGKDGFVSVFGSRELEVGQLKTADTLPPLLSHKLHKGWVSDVQLTSLHPSSSPPLLLLTAGNDGAVRLWDLGRVAEAGGNSGVPQQLTQTNDIHTGEQQWSRGCRL